MINSGFVKPAVTASCALLPVDANIEQQVARLFDRGNKLIKYRIEINQANATVDKVKSFNRTSKLKCACGDDDLHCEASHNDSFYYFKPLNWVRVAGINGRSLLALPYDYEVLSLAILTIGTSDLTVKLHDYPVGCFEQLQQEDKIQAIRDILIQDLNPQRILSKTNLDEDDSLCTTTVQSKGSSSEFNYQCWHVRNGILKCGNLIKGPWLDTLSILIRIIHCLIFLFLPTFFPSWIFKRFETGADYEIFNPGIIATNSNLGGIQSEQQTHPAQIQSEQTQPAEIQSEQQSDSSTTSFSKEQIEIPLPKIHVGKTVTPTKIHVDYKHMLTEVDNPVSLFRMFYHICKQKDKDSKEELSRQIEKDYKYASILHFLHMFLFLFMVLPLPCIARIVVDETFLRDEINSRREFIQNLNLKFSIEFSFIQFFEFFTNRYIALVSIFVVYGVSGLLICLSYMDVFKYLTGARLVLKKSFEDLEDSGYRPLVKCQVSGDWTEKAVLPFSVFPTIYLFLRVLLNPLVLLICAHEIQVKGRRSRIKEYQRELKKLKASKACVLLLSFLVCVPFVVCTLIIIFEGIGLVVEILASTLMGAIVNAQFVLPFSSLVILIGVYAHDAFSGVINTYCGLSQHIIKHLYELCKDDINAEARKQITEQTPTAFQVQKRNKDTVSVDNNIPNGHSPDTITLPVCVFLDSNDVARYPYKLFRRVCRIKVAGAPGRVHKQIGVALRYFLSVLVFLVFVFVVVGTFGTFYKISATNKTFATLAGGFLPLLFRHFLKPPTKDSGYQNTALWQCKLEETLFQYHQTWYIVKDDNKNFKKDAFVLKESDNGERC